MTHDAIPRRMRYNVSMNTPVKLIATDLDGTLLRRDGTISARSRAAIRYAQDACIIFVVVTGRSPRSLTPIAVAHGITGLAITSNGAIHYDLTTNTIVQHDPIAPEVARRIIELLRAVAPGICFACECGLEFGCEPSYEVLHPRALNHGSWRADALELCAMPLTKILALHPTIYADDLLILFEQHSITEVTPTMSGLPFIEISAAGIDKGTALAQLCASRAIPASAVVAFGDMPNDLPMLRWAGRGIAVANAHPAVLASADEVTLANDEDGVALVMERLLRI